MKKKSKVVEKVKQSNNEFLSFLKKYNVMELAIGVVIGGAAKDLVNSVANDMIMPIVGIVSPNGSWRSLVFKIANSEFKIGNLLGSALNFLIIAIVVFVISKKLIDRKEKLN